MELDLTKIREEIDDVDSNIVKLFEKRMRLCNDVALYKIENNKEVLDKERENIKLQNVISQTKNDFNAEGVEELFTQIMSLSRKLQYKLMTEHGVNKKISFKQVDELKKDGVTVVYQGVEGAYSHQAMTEYFGKNVKNFNVATFRDAFEAVKEGRADYAVLPIENSTAGIVNDVHDLMVEYDNCLVDEIDICIRHALLGNSDADINNIDVVYSHPQGLMQCREYLDEHKGWQRVAQGNTAMAAKKVLEDGISTHAAIASKLAAEIYNLKVLDENINRNEDNTTKFIIVQKEKVYKKDAKKVSICFEVPHKSGTLYNILSHFIYNGLNMTKIESRPKTDKSWEYKFFIDFEGNFNDPATLNALTGIEEEASKLIVLGNY